MFTSCEWLHFLFLSPGLSASRSTTEKTKIVDEFFRRYEAEVAENPADHGMDFVHCFMFIEKRC